MVRASEADAGGDKGGLHVDNRAQEDQEEVHDDRKHEGHLVGDRDRGGGIAHSGRQLSEEAPEGNRRIVCDVISLHKRDGGNYGWTGTRGKEMGLELIKADLSTEW